MTVRRLGRPSRGSKGVSGWVAVRWRRAKTAPTTRATAVAMITKIMGVPPVLSQTLSIMAHLSCAATCTSDIGCLPLGLKSVTVIWVVDPGGDSLSGLD
jgi:hypothetical protein